MPLTELELAEIAAAAFCDDIPIPAVAIHWTEEQAIAFFESGGEILPPPPQQPHRFLHLCCCSCAIAWPCGGRAGERPVHPLVRARCQRARRRCQPCGSTHNKRTRQWQGDAHSVAAAAAALLTDEPGAQRGGPEPGRRLPSSVSSPSSVTRASAAEACGARHTC